MLGFAFEDLPVGRQYKTIGRTITETDIVNYVNCTGLVEVLFINAEFQKHESDIKGRLAVLKVHSRDKKLADDGTDFRLLTGTEVDILKEKLDFADDLLAELDVVVASLHVAGSDEADNTKRLLRAAENPHVHMLGHLTGRLLLERNPYPVNQQAVIDACAATGTWIELNASPWRFDLDWRLWHYARSQGVKCVINCDAHRLDHIGYLRLGTGVARNETAAFNYLMRAARKGSPVGQSRLAFMYGSGRGVKGDPVQAIRWHLIAQAGGNNDPFLDEYMRKQKPETIAAGQEAAKSWIARLNLARQAAAQGLEPVPAPVSRPAPVAPPPPR